MIFSNACNNELNKIKRFMYLYINVFFIPASQSKVLARTIKELMADQKPSGKVTIIPYIYYNSP